MNKLAISSISSLLERRGVVIDTQFLSNEDEERNFIDVNKIFWTHLFSKEKIQSLIEFLADVYPDGTCNIPQYIEIMNDPDKFVEKVQEALIVLDQLGTEDLVHFEARETITILLSIYSELDYNPHNLSFDSGFELNDYSSDIIFGNLMNSEMNPYLDFLQENILPIIKEKKPDVLFLQGRPDFSNLTMALLVKKNIPHCHVSLTRHSSEYFSLNNIAEFLKKNDRLFKIINSIVLDDCENTENILFQALEAGKDLETVPNLLWFDGAVIIQNEYKISIPKLKMISEKIKNENSKFLKHSEIVTTKLWPESHCYWNSCSFCNINAKYKTLLPEDVFGNLQEKADYFKNAIEAGYRFLNFIDEAVPPEALSQLAKELKNNNIPLINWSIRSRVDKGFTPEVCKELAESGLKSIYIGLESSNARILKLMNKFDAEFSLSLAEDVVSNFNSAGVLVNYCFIVGFPGETDAERKETYDYIEYLLNKYSRFTFTINLFHFMMGSRLYENALKYEIDPVFPCRSESFLENIMWYKSHENPVKLAKEKTDFLKKTIFSWLPDNAMTSPESLAQTSKLNALIRQLHVEGSL